MKIIDDKVVFIDDEGNRTELKIYFTYKNQENNRNYVFFYDELMPEELIAGRIEEDGTIQDIESDEEYDELDAILEEYESEQENSKKE